MRAEARVSGFPCPGGCGKQTDSGSWCGQCSWLALQDGLREAELHATMRTEGWPTAWTWGRPAKAGGLW